MRIPKPARRQAKRIFRICVTDGLLDQNRLGQAVNHILALRPRGYLPLLVYLQRLVELEQERRSALIESAGPLEAGLASKVQANLELRYGPGLTFRFVEKPSLLAGLRVRVGSDVYDGTVAGRLDEVRQTFDIE